LDGVYIRPCNIVGIVYFVTNLVISDMLGWHESITIILNACFQCYFGIDVCTISYRTDKLGRW